METEAGQPQLRAGALGPIDRVQFTSPLRGFLLMLFSLALVGAGIAVAFPRVSGIFLANIGLNGTILLVFVVGVFSTFWQMTQLMSSVRWIRGFVAETPGHQITIAPRLLAPLAALLRSRGRERHISSTSARSILESAATRIDEQREITRYIVNLLIFLGLLGTFYGLATSVPAVVDTIRSLAPQPGESALDGFGRLMSGLEEQMGGMGTAFSSSLLGLAGSLVVGLLELFASQAQNRFYRELEEWLSSITRLGSAASEGEGAPSGLALDAVATLIDGLAETVDRLSLRMEMEASTGAALQHLTEGQDRIVALMEAQMTPGGEAAEPHVEAETRARLRSMDVQLVRILEELSAGRQESLADLRGDLASLTQAVRQLNRQPPPAIHDVEYD